MGKIVKHVQVQDKSFDAAGIRQDYESALIEYMWNGFEAGATTVELSYELNETQGVKSITIHDNGSGIDFNQIDDTFGAFMVSQKNNIITAMKSKKNRGIGRHAYQSIGRSAMWTTIYSDGDSLKRFTIEIEGDKRNDYVVTTPELADETEMQGTTVIIEDVSGVTAEQLSISSLECRLLGEFAWFLYLNRDRQLLINGDCIYYSKAMNMDLSKTVALTINKIEFEISFISWIEKQREVSCCYFIDDYDCLNHKKTTSFNRNAVDFYHSVFIKSVYFNDFIMSESIMTEQVGLESCKDQSDKTYRELQKQLKRFIGDQLSKFLKARATHTVRLMYEKGTFPKFGDALLQQMKKKELEDVVIEIYCIEPRIFYKLNDIQEKSVLGFLKLLLSSEERDNILTIIESVTELSPEDRKGFANMLTRTKLSNIIETIQLIDRRTSVVESLKKLIYDLKKFTTERGQIQKIIEQNYWLFGEEYNLVAADKSFENILMEHYERELGKQSEGDLRRPDIFMCRTRTAASVMGEETFEHVIVELKRPSVRLTKKVYRQIEDYCEIVISKNEWNSDNRHWKFIVIGTDTDEFVKEKIRANQAWGRRCLASYTEKYEIYAMKWDDVFTSFDLRHRFIYNTLQTDSEILLRQMGIDSVEKSAEGAEKLVQRIAQ